MSNKNVIKISYVKEGYLSLWLCNTQSENLLRRYVEKNYEDEDGEEEDKIKFQLGRDFNIWRYDEDFFEASYKGNMKGWDLLGRHSYIESIIPALKESCQDVMDDTYNGIIIFYDFKYDGNVTEIENDQYGYFRFVGAFKYEIPGTRLVE